MNEVNNEQSVTEPTVDPVVNVEDKAAENFDNNVSREPEKKLEDTEKKELTKEGEESTIAPKENEKFSPELIERAKLLGYHDVSKFDSPEFLEKYLEIKESEILNAGRYDLNQQPKVNAPQQTQPVVDANSRKCFQMAFANPEEYDDQLLNNLHGLNSYVNKNITVQEQRIEALEKTIRVLAETHHTKQFDEFDALLSGLGSDYEKYVGKGTLSDLDPGNEHKQIRDKIWDEKEVLRRGYERSGLRVPNEKILFEKAVSIVLGDKKKEIMKNELVKKAEKLQNGRIMKPTSRDVDKSLSAEEKAAKRIDDALGRMKGME
jgi:hypothetical protein